MAVRSHMRGEGDQIVLDWFFSIREMITGTGRCWDTSTVMDLTDLLRVIFVRRLEESHKHTN